MVVIILWLVETRRLACKQFIERAGLEEFIRSFLYSLNRYLGFAWGGPREEKQGGPSRLPIPAVWCGSVTSLFWVSPPHLGNGEMVSIMFTSRVVLRLKRVQVHSRWSVCVWFLSSPALLMTGSMISGKSLNTPGIPPPQGSCCSLVVHSAWNSLPPNTFMTCSLMSLIFFV